MSLFMCAQQLVAHVTYLLYKHFTPTDMTLKLLISDFPLFFPYYPHDTDFFIFFCNFSLTTTTVLIHLSFNFRVIFARHRSIIEIVVNKYKRSPCVDLFLFFLSFRIFISMFFLTCRASQEKGMIN